MDAQPDGAVFTKNFGELGRDALRKKNRNPRTNPDKFDVLDGTETPEKRVQLGIREQQRVATRQQYIANLGMLLDILQTGFKLGMEIIGLGVGNQAAARAITAIRCTTIGHQEQDAVGVAMDDTRDGHRPLFANRILGLARGDVGLLDSRNHLSAHRAVRVLGVDQIEEVGRDRKRELMRCEQAPFSLLLGQFKHLL